MGKSKVLSAWLIIGMLGMVGCGKPQAPIVSDGSGVIGGVDANGNEEFSSTLVLLYNVTQGSLCTASILSDSILLTAAHCVDGPNESLRVVFGKDIRDEGNIVLRKVEDYKVSPLWPFRASENIDSGDIAIVKFSGGLPSGYRPTTLLRDAAKLVDGGTVTVAGYGLNNPVTKKGSGRLRYADVTIKNVKYSQSEILLDQSQGRGACHGDSGGPAYAKIDGKYVVVGITNRGVDDPDDTCGVSAAFASVAFWMPWVEQTITELNKVQPTRRVLFAVH